MAGDMRFEPLEIEPSADGARLVIRWKDGVDAEYEPRLLRQRCPCAGCVDEMTGIRTLSPDDVPEGVYPQQIQYVGRYALQFFWSDGHSTGIYPFRYLRGISDEPGGNQPGQSST
jgi:DUF971 family protein